VDTLTFTREGTTWTVYGQDIIGKHLFVRGQFDLDGAQELITWLNARPVGKRPVIINVGANIGSSCIPMAKLTGKRVLAIEPLPRTYAVLTRNIEQNGITSQVQAIRAAVTPTRMVVEMITPSDTGKSEIKTSTQGFTAALGSTAGEVSTADGIPLDDLIAPHRPGDIALVWSDTQGFETSVINSGATLWAAGVPLWVELWPDGLEAHGGIEPFLDSCRCHFQAFILDLDFEEHRTLREQPIAHLGDVIRDITVGNRQDRRHTTDVLLIPQATASRKE
jgi:FkbM family methyltransferase